MWDYMILMSYPDNKAVTVTSNLATWQLLPPKLLNCKVQNRVVIVKTKQKRNECKNLLNTSGIWFMAQITKLENRKWFSKNISSNDWDMIYDIWPIVAQCHGSAFINWWTKIWRMNSKYCISEYKIYHESALKSSWNLLDLLVPFFHKLLEASKNSHSGNINCCVLSVWLWTPL